MIVLCIGGSLNGQTKTIPNAVMAFRVSVPTPTKKLKMKGGMAKVADMSVQHEQYVCHPVWHSELNRVEGVVALPAGAKLSQDHIEIWRKKFGYA